MLHASYGMQVLATGLTVDEVRAMAAAEAKAAGRRPAGTSGLCGCKY
jgi:hypothetical protein